ncbi:unnamed protein product, partial [Brassica oleracea]
QDAFVWLPSSSRTYTAKSRYFSSQSQSNQSTIPLSAPSTLSASTTIGVSNLNDSTTQILLSPIESFDLKKAIWNPPLNPKIKMFLWKAAQEALPMGVNLQRRGVLSNTNCCCRGLQESTLHIFIQYGFAQEVSSYGPWNEPILTTKNHTFKDLIWESRKWITLPPWELL